MFWLRNYKKYFSITTLTWRHVDGCYLQDTLRKVLDRLDAIEDNLSTVGSERTIPGSRASEFMRSRSRSPAMMVSSDSRPFSAVQYAFEGGLRGELHHAYNQINKM